MAAHERSATRRIVESGALAGFIAGEVMILLVMIASVWTNMGFGTPFGAFGTIVMPSAVRDASLVGALLGLVLHAILSVLIGIFLTAVLLRRLGELASVVAAIVASIAVWSILLFVLARALAPELARLAAQQPLTWFDGMVAYGAVLGSARSFLDAFTRADEHRGAAHAKG
jgi:hypothetical protein